MSTNKRKFTAKASWLFLPGNDKPFSNLWFFREKLKKS
jgi:hypothetical protein